MWDQARLERFITEGIEESLTLEYKAAPALDKSQQRKDEITKDVSAMANAAGGTLIYGIMEHQENGKRHLPSHIDPIDRADYSKEWLEQVISNIRPRIDGIVIHPVPLNTAPNHVVYVVEIPQSDTAHQANSKKYYKRFNFESVPMDDYEIRDIMSRAQHPRIDLSFSLEITTRTHSNYMSNGQTRSTVCVLMVRAQNVGRAYAQYVNSFIKLPNHLLSADLDNRKVFEEDGILYAELYEDNTVRDVVDVEMIGAHPIQKYGPARFDPILPSLSLTWEIPLVDSYLDLDVGGLMLKWRTYADNAPVNQGIVPIKNIPKIDRRNQ
jgi:hypothetical protein